MDTCLQSVPLPFPGSHFPSDFVLVVYPSIEALAVHDADLCLGHVDPTTVLGRVMPLDLVQNPAGVLGWERFVEAGPVMGVEVILHQADLPGLGVMHLH